jgi:transposase-like protein
VSKTRDKKAALKFLRKQMKRHGRAEELVTDGTQVVDFHPELSRLFHREVSHL